MSATADQHPYATQLAMRARIERAVADGPLAFVDLGSAKTAVLIAEAVSEGRARSFRVLGAAIRPSRGVEDGAPRDLDAIEATLADALREASAVARRRPGAAVVTMAGLAPRSSRAAAETELAAGAVVPEDIARTIAAAPPPAEGEHRLRLHGLATRWRIDGAAALGDPTGRFGKRLSVAMHAVSVDRRPLQDAARALRAVGLDLAAAAAAPYAAALAATTTEERAMGAACVDFGASGGSIAVFDHGRLSAVDTTPLGGDKTTAQIAASLGLEFDDAERLKIADGSAASRTPEGAVRATRRDKPPVNIQRVALAAAIRPRVLDALAEARDRAAEAGAFAAAERPIVLTGGAADLTGFAAAAEEIFGPRVRIAGPIGPSALEDLAPSGAWAAAVGLVRFVAGPPELRFSGVEPIEPPSRGLWSWLRENW